MKILITKFILLIEFINGYSTNRLELTNRRIIRIANGEHLDQDNYYPFVVGLKMKHLSGNTYFCSGSLITPVFVLTAAHCITESINTKVYRNDPRNLTSEIRSAVKYIKHSLFNETSLVADLCLIKINKPFKNITNYAIISGYPKLFENETALDCFIIGWGKDTLNISGYTANIASVRVKYGSNACKIPPNNDFIKKIVENTWQEFLCPVPDSRMVCIGDSGGPLMCQGFLFGITSHGYNYFPGMGFLKPQCGDNRVQTRHIFIYKYREWIQNTINGTCNTAKFNAILLYWMFWLSSIQSYVTM